jgi:hypothetical protein
MRTHLSRKTWKDEVTSETLGVGGRIILKWILWKETGRVGVCVVDWIHLLQDRTDGSWLL